MSVQIGHQVCFSIPAQCANLRVSRTFAQQPPFLKCCYTAIEEFGCLFLVEHSIHLHHVDSSFSNAYMLIGKSPDALINSGGLSNDLFVGKVKNLWWVRTGRS